MQGATATHPTDGDLSALLDACSPGHRLTTHGLTACSIDTSTLGNYTVQFFLSDATLTISSNIVTRTIVVHPACAESEQLCSDNTCSTGGFCFDGTPTAQAQNSPPTLAFSAGDPQAIYVPRGTAYGFCNTTSEASTSAGGFLCEAGPAAADEEDGDLTHRVLACPPVQCLSVGCPGHELQTKGLAGCGVDTVNAPIGTSFNITFTVFDLNRPAASASLFRLVTVATPCALGQQYCPDSSVQCADAPCNLRDVLEAAEAPLSPPELVVDLSGVPERSAELQGATTSGSRTLSIWGLCGRRLPVDFTHICAQSGSAQKPSGELWASQQCATTTATTTQGEVGATDATGDQCTVSVEQDGGIGALPTPTVAIVREVEDSCGGDVEDASAADCDVVRCSLAALAGGRCSPSRQVFTMHALHESSSAAGGELQELRVEAEVLRTVANATAAMHANVSVGDVQHREHLAALAALASGTEQCSIIASALHGFVAQHVQASLACESFRTAAASAAEVSRSDAAVAVEVTQAQHTQTDVNLDDIITDSPGTFTPVGFLEITVIIEIGVKFTVNSSSTIEAAATACLDAAQGEVLLWDDPSGSNAQDDSDSDSPESDAGAKLPVDVQTASGPDEVLFLVTSVEVESVAAHVAACPAVAVEEASIDEMAAAVEDAEMQQHITELTAEVRTCHRWAIALNCRGRHLESR